ncbi:MAG: S41 family peptidase [Eubacteriales bacterium]|nr:S41 family peptidase [Eubacteriales bacterium]
MIKITKTRFILFLTAAFMIGALIFGGAGALMLNSEGAIFSGNDKLAEIRKNIHDHYLFDYDEKELMDGLYKGYVDSLNDPYSSYMNKKEFESYMTTTKGEYSGVGITFTMVDGKYRVVGVTKDSPAEMAGIEEGDYILLVDGKEYADQDIMAAKIRGDEGTKVTLTMLHNKKEKEVTMIRQDIKQESVSYKMLDSETAYIGINQFVDNTSEDFEKALKAVTKNGVNYLILDLRDNGGGLVDQCVEIADWFLDEGVVCYIKDKKGDLGSFDAKNGKTELETVVMINENSASSAEILAAAMKDNGYDTIGTRSFGKGIIQNTITLKDGSALKLTIMEFLSPEKHKIHNKGIKPDYIVKDKKKTKEDEQLEKAKELLQTL